MADKPQRIVLPDDGPNSLKQWKARIQAAEEKRDRIKAEFHWDDNIKSYLAKGLKVSESDQVAVPKEFGLVEQKKGQLFFQTPEVLLSAREDVVSADAVSKFQAVLNHQLGPNGVDVQTAMTEGLFDLLCPAGFMAAKIGYENVVDGVTQIQVGEEPVPQEPIPGSVLGLQALPPIMQPIMQTVPNVIWERYFWERISPGKILIPDDFSGFDYDKAPWLGHKFRMDLAKARQAWPNIPADFEGKAADDKDRLGIESKSSDTRGKSHEVCGYELFIHAALYDETVKHPDVIKRLVLIDGLDEPVAYDQPYQRWNDNNQLIGMMGNPVHITAIRYVSDSAYPPSDCWESRNLVNELNKGRGQMIQQRDRNIPMRIADFDRVGGDEGMEKVRKGLVQGIIPLSGASQNDPPVFEMARANFPRENFEFNSIISDDISEVWAMGRNQLGIAEDEEKSATETANVQTNSQVRLEGERDVVLRSVARGVQKLGGLIQLFADKTDYVEIVGQDGEKRLEAWDKTHIQGKFAYAVKPDSAIRVDASQERNQSLKLYQMTANDPNVNRVELLNTVFRKHNFDPARIVVAQLPEKKPDPPNISYRFSGDDLDPTMPKFPIILEILRQGGVQISEQAIQQAEAHATLQAQILNAAGVGGVPAAGDTGQGRPPLQSEHGGPAVQQTPLSKHQLDESGGMPGVNRTM